MADFKNMEEKMQCVHDLSSLVGNLSSRLGRFAVYADFDGAKDVEIVNAETSLIDIESALESALMAVREARGILREAKEGL